eukprot:4676389-Ditylum_brightwellii.AAC.1
MNDILIHLMRTEHANESFIIQALFKQSIHQHANMNLFIVVALSSAAIFHVWVLVSNSCFRHATSLNIASI